jgi:Fe-S cluster assembly scaffold protein SufB
MCHEEDVEGAHGVSTGKIDNDKLFYLESRGYTEQDAKKLIILSNFNKILGCMKNQDIKNMVYEYLDKII